MTADVYAGDDDQNRAGTSPTTVAMSVIRLRADAGPDVLFRVAAQLNLLNCAPVRFVLEQGSASDVIVKAHVAGCSEASLDLVCRKLERLTCVYEVDREFTC